MELIPRKKLLVQVASLFVAANVSLIHGGNNSNNNNNGCGATAATVQSTSDNDDNGGRRMTTMTTGAMDATEAVSRVAVKVHHRRLGLSGPWCAASGSSRGTTALVAEMKRGYLEEGTTRGSLKATRKRCSAFSVKDEAFVGTPHFHSIWAKMERAQLKLSIGLASQIRQFGRGNEKFALTHFHESVKNYFDSVWKVACLVPKAIPPAELDNATAYVMFPLREFLNFCVRKATALAQEIDVRAGESAAGRDAVDSGYREFYRRLLKEEIEDEYNEDDRTKADGGVCEKLWELCYICRTVNARFGNDLKLGRPAFPLGTLHRDKLEAGCTLLTLPFEPTALDESLKAECRALIDKYLPAEQANGPINTSLAPPARSSLLVNSESELRIGILSRFKEANESNELALTNFHGTVKKYFKSVRKIYNHAERGSLVEVDGRRDKHLRDLSRFLRPSLASAKEIITKIENEAGIRRAERKALHLGYRKFYLRLLESTDHGGDRLEEDGESVFGWLWKLYCIYGEVYDRLNRERAAEAPNVEKTSLIKDTDKVSHTLLSLPFKPTALDESLKAECRALIDKYLPAEQANGPTETSLATRNRSVKSIAPAPPDSLRRANNPTNTLASLSSGSLQPASSLTSVQGSSLVGRRLPTA